MYIAVKIVKSHYLYVVDVEAEGRKKHPKHVVIPGHIQKSDEIHKTTDTCLNLLKIVFHQILEYTFVTMSKLFNISIE